MPILVVNLSEELHGLVLRDRVLIGRRPFNTIMLADPAVSRLHAWIGRRDGHWTLFDAGSRIGTVVNTQVLEEPHLLVDGDEIRIGQTIISFHEADELPGDVKPLDPAPPPPAADPYDGGIYFDCACGGPMWVAASMAGATGRCRYCGQRLVVPHMSGSKARPLVPASVESGEVAPQAPRQRKARPAPETFARIAAPARAAPPEAPVLAPAAPSRVFTPPRPPETPLVAAPSNTAALVAAPPAQVGTCSICQSTIFADEAQTSCPSCHLTFHQQCWEENLGCGAYGCDQVNVLAPVQETVTTTDEDVPPIQALSYDSEALADRPGVAWEPVILALSFVAMALGALAFGIPSVIMQMWALVYLLMGKPRRKGMVIAALFVGLVGFLAGFAMSMFWWRQERVWEWLHK
jgi:hypothetical protein